VWADYHYYGVGDQGGAPREEDVRNYVASVDNSDSLIRVGDGGYQRKKGPFAIKKFTGGKPSLAIAGLLEHPIGLKRNLGWHRWEIKGGRAGC
jgi:hypothetical protein